MNLDFEIYLYLSGIDIRREILKILYESDISRLMIAFLVYSPVDNEIRQLKVYVNKYEDSVENILNKMKNLAKKNECILLTPLTNEINLNHVISLVEEKIERKINILRL